MIHRERKNFSLVALTPLRDFHLTERDETNISPKKKIFITSKAKQNK